MGLFGKKMDQKMADAQAQAAAAMAGMAQPQMGGLPGADAPGMGGQDMAAMAAYSQMVNKIATSGVEAPGVLHEFRATGTPDISGATMHEFDVSIRPEGADVYQTTIQQSMLPFQMEGISEGMAIVVKFDPDNPSAAIMHSW